MSKRKWPVGSFVPCSPRHLHCSPAHAEFVRNYRIERHRQEVEHEHILSNPQERAIWRENGGEIVTFKSWLITHKGSGIQHQREVWESAQRAEASALALNGRAECIASVDDMNQWRQWAWDTIEHASA
ncbi:hypothetical protein HWB99_gp061 [Mycobacterium phage DrLupo]|uniref:Uncharacterized protein n=1 Tax=Mycobacterium phage DrLupo TaxID=2499037 RepID=A0A3S9UQL8_9CAUD|nr:hypothetical protein HWB99_gp061 [Mycobacterium phage DrLupo]AZS12597.1 hypothetical protein SEA_DRLUPO_61 [Mycobacterium phage DrLupo]